MKLLVINGANLDMLGIREPEKYGNKSYVDLEKYINDNAKDLGLDVEIFRSNFEGEIIEKIHGAYKKFDGIIINAGGYTHTSVAILDALLAVNIRTVEVHLTDITKRESFRAVSYIRDASEQVYMGEGFLSYKKALEHFSK